MRIKFGHVKWLLAVGIILVGAYTVLLSFSPHGYKSKIDKDLSHHKHHGGVRSPKHEDLPRKNTPGHDTVKIKSSLGRDSDDEKDLSVHKLNRDIWKEPDSNSEKIVVWAVLASENSWSIDLLLKSIQGFGVILLTQSVKTDSADKVLQNHNINPLANPYKCSKRQGENGFTEAGCHKNEWLWLMRQAWSLSPDVVCFTTDDNVLHPDAKTFILDNAPDVFNGLKLTTSEEVATPWCFGPKIWSRLQKVVADFCSSDQQNWEQIIASMLGKKISDVKNEAIVPSKDLTMILKECRITKWQESSSCSQEQISKIQENVAAWRERSISEVETISRPWLALHKRTSPVSTFLEHAQCMGHTCEFFQMQPEKDNRVYSSYVQDGRGQTAYLVDLGPTCIDMSKIRVAPGGEKVADVMGRDEEVEFPRYEKGAFRVVNEPPTFSFPLYHKDVIRATVVTGETPKKFDYNGTTFAYTRGDYANVCFVIAELFNLYIAKEHAPSNRMIWLDGHALGNLDELPSTVLDMNVMRLGQMTGEKCFEKLVLLPKKSLLYYVPQRGTCDIEDFVSKMLRKYNITASEKKQDTVIVRDFYMAHPRATNKVSRKFSDRDMENIKRKLPNVNFVRFHDFPWQKQLQIIANTKNLYAMHGAGLTLGLFLGKGSTVVEWTHPSRIGTLTFQHYMSWRPEVEFKRMTLQNWLDQDGK